MDQCITRCYKHDCCCWFSVWDRLVLIRNRKTNKSAFSSTEFFLYFWEDGREIPFCLHFCFYAAVIELEKTDFTHIHIPMEIKEGLIVFLEINTKEKLRGQDWVMKMNQYWENKFCSKYNHRKSPGCCVSWAIYHKSKLIPVRVNETISSDISEL